MRPLWPFLYYLGLLVLVGLNLPKDLSLQTKRGFRRPFEGVVPLHSHRLDGGGRSRTVDGVGGGEWCRVYGLGCDDSWVVGWDGGGTDARGQNGVRR